MPILRHAHKKNFTILSNDAIRDPQLSLKGVGLLAVLMSLPDNWEFSVSGLDAILPKDGAASIRAGISELEMAKYLKRLREREESGRFGNAIWLVSDQRLSNV